MKMGVMPFVIILSAFLQYESRALGFCLPSSGLTKMAGSKLGDSFDSSSQMLLALASDPEIVKVTEIIGGVQNVCIVSALVVGLPGFLYAFPAILKASKYASLVALFFVRAFFASLPLVGQPLTAAADFALLFIHCILLPEDCLDHWCSKLSPELTQKSTQGLSMALMLLMLTCAVGPSNLVMGQPFFNTDFELNHLGEMLPRL